MSTTIFAGNVDFSTLEFGKLETDPMTKRQYVPVTLAGRKPRFSLCKDDSDMLVTPFALDIPQEAGKDARRTQTALAHSTDLQDAMRAIDEAVVKMAMSESKNWFKAVLSEEVIRSRYKSCMQTKDGQDSPLIRFKVKCPPSKYPTDIYCQLSGETQDGKMQYRRSDHNALCKKGASVYPTVSMVEVWFMSGGSSFGISMQAEELLMVEGESHNPLKRFKTKHPSELLPEASSHRQDDLCISPPTRDPHDDVPIAKELAL